MLDVSAVIYSHQLSKNFSFASWSCQIFKRCYVICDEDKYFLSAEDQHTFTKWLLQKLSISTSFCCGHQGVSSSSFVMFESSSCDFSKKNGKIGP